MEGHLARGVMRRAERLAAACQLFEIRCGDQSEVTDKPAAVELIEVAWLDVAVTDTLLGKASERHRDLRERDDYDLERRLREGIGDRRGDRHCQPGSVGAARALGQVRVK